MGSTKQNVCEFARLSVKMSPLMKSLLIIHDGVVSQFETGLNLAEPPPGHSNGGGADRAKGFGTGLKKKKKKQEEKVEEEGEKGNRKWKNKRKKDVEKEDEGMFVVMACCYTLISSAGSKTSPSENTFSITNRAAPTSDLQPGSAASHLEKKNQRKKSDGFKSSRWTGTGSTCRPDRQVNLRHLDRTNRSQPISPITEGVTLQQRPLQGKHHSLL